MLNGNFDYDDDPTSLINYKEISAIWTNIHIKKDKNIYLVADIARYGSDKAIIMIFAGFVIIDFVSFDISSTTLIQNTINSLRIKYRISAKNCIADEDGVGGGIVDNCKILGFVNNSRPKDPQYFNLKSECGYKLAEQFEKEGFYFEKDISEENKTQIETELGQLKTFDADKDNKLRIMPKAKIKENIGNSPDWLDTFIMRMYFEINKNENWIKF